MRAMRAWAWACVCLTACGDVAGAAEETSSTEESSTEESSTEESSTEESSTEETSSEPEPEPTCIPLEMTPVDHVAFDGDQCQFAATQSVTLATQAEVDAHVAAFCPECCQGCSPPECSKAPKLTLGEILVYAHDVTPQAEAELDILSVEDCGDRLVVTALETLGCELVFSRVWDSVTVIAEAKPVELVIEAGPDLCAEPGDP